MTLKMIVFWIKNINFPIWFQQDFHRWQLLLAILHIFWYPKHGLSKRPYCGGRVVARFWRYCEIFYQEKWFIYLYTSLYGNSVRVVHLTDSVLKWAWFNIQLPEMYSGWIYFLLFIVRWTFRCNIVCYVLHFAANGQALQSWVRLNTLVTFDVDQMLPSSEVKSARFMKLCISSNSRCYFIEPFVVPVDNCCFLFPLLPIHG